MKTPEIHVYGTPALRRVVWRDGEREVDLTALDIVEVSRRVVVDEPSITTVLFFARLVEHGEREASA